MSLNSCVQPTAAQVRRGWVCEGREGLGAGLVMCCAVLMAHVAHIEFPHVAYFESLHIAHIRALHIAHIQFLHGSQFSTCRAPRMVGFGSRIEFRGHRSHQNDQNFEPNPMERLPDPKKLVSERFCRVLESGRVWGVACTVLCSTSQASMRFGPTTVMAQAAIGWVLC